MAEIVSISDSVYPIDEVINDLDKIKDTIKDIVFVTILKDGTAYVSHTGLNFMLMALACKLMDKEFDNLVNLNSEEEEE